MTAWEAVGACIATAILLLAAATKGWDRWHKPRTTSRFQRTARKAASAPRTEADVERDLAAAKAARDRVSDLAECLAIWDATQHDIPHQARRTEEDR